MTNDREDRMRTPWVEPKLDIEFVSEREMRAMARWIGVAMILAAVAAVAVAWMMWFG